MFYRLETVPYGAVAIIRYENEHDTHGKSIAFLQPGDDANGVLDALDYAGSVLAPEQYARVEQDILSGYDYTT